MSQPRSETLEITATDRGGHSSFIDIPITWTGTAARYPGDPGGYLRGQSHKGGVAGFLADGRPQQLGAIVGKPVQFPQLFHIYMTPPQSTVAGAQQAIQDALTVRSWGAYPLIDVKEPPGKSFAQVAAGQMDNVIDTLVEGAVANNLACTLSYHDEPAGDNVGGVVNDYQGYANAVGRFGIRAQLAGAGNLVNCTGALGQGQYTNFGGGNGSPMPWLLNLASVCGTWNDHRYLQIVTATPASKWITPQALNGPFWDMQDQAAMQVLGHLLPRFHGEWGVHTKPDDYTFAPAWMDTWETYFHSRGGVADSFFDSIIDSANNWTLDTPVNGRPDTTRLVTRAQQYAGLVD